MTAASDTTHTTHTARAVLVTGAARRLGRTIALAFARDGWDVALHYRNSEADAHATARDIESLGQRCVLVQGNLDAETSARQVFADAAEALPHLTALINNASAFRYDAATTVTQDGLLAHLLPNLVAPVILAQALHRHLLTTNQSASLAVDGEVKRGHRFMEPKAHQTCGGEAPTARSEFFTRRTATSPPAPLPHVGEGRLNDADMNSPLPPGGRGAGGEGAISSGVVINLLDQKLWNLNPDFFSYTISKAALSTATTLLAQALAPTLRVVGVAPGLTLPSYLQSDAAFARTHALAPLGRASDPDDVARTVLFAATSRSITGTTLIVDGGQHLMGLAQDFSLLADSSNPDAP